MHQKMNKIIYLTFLFLVIKILLLTNICNGQNGAINLSLGLNRQISNNIKKYNTGGHFSPGIEYRFNSRFALEGMVQFGIHNFDNKFNNYLNEEPANQDFPTLSVRNTIFAAGITPKIFFSNHSGNWEYFVGPQLLLYNIKSDISIHNIEQTWYGFLDKSKVIGYYKSANNLSTGLFVGIKRRVHKDKTFSVQLGWQPINFGKTMNRIGEVETIKPQNFQTNQLVVRVCFKWKDGFIFLKDMISGILYGLI